MLEDVRARLFAHDHRAALELLRNESVPSAELQFLAGIAHIFLGELETAKTVLTIAIARGARAALGALASAHRLERTPRTYLETVTPEECMAFEPFARALLEREIGLWWLERERFETALEWLECAWYTALTGPYGDQQLSGIATPLAAVLARVGFDARAVSVLDEGTRRCDRHRRVPLLYERALRNLSLGRVEACMDDVLELETCVPGGDPTLPALVAYLRGRLHHASGEVTVARAHLRDALDAARPLEQLEMRETALHAQLWLATLELEADRADEAEAWLRLAEVFATGVRDHSWLALRGAQMCALQGEYHKALAGFESAVRGFSNLGARVEQGIAHLHRANALLHMGYDHEDEAGAALLEAVRLTSEVGGAAPLRLELSTLARVRSYLEQPYTHAEVKRLLAPEHRYRHVTINGDRLECDGVRLSVSASGVRLIAYLRDYPCSSWMHLRGSVYANLPMNAAQLAFTRDRVVVSSVEGLEIVYSGAGHTYSLAWRNLTLETSSVRMLSLGAPCDAPSL